jgi:hypothetical protein
MLHDRDSPKLAAQKMSATEVDPSRRSSRGSPSAALTRSRRRATALCLCAWSMAITCFGSGGTILGAGPVLARGRGDVRRCARLHRAGGARGHDKPQPHDRGSAASQARQAPRGRRNRACLRGRGRACGASHRHLFVAGAIDDRGQARCWNFRLHPSTSSG